MKYLKQFVIGSSYLVFVSFFYEVSNNVPFMEYILNRKLKINFKYSNYTFVAPLWFGLWNVISLIIAYKFNLTMKQRFLFISIISFLTLMFLQQLILKPYNLTKIEWFKYYCYMFIKYLLIWNFVIYNIEKYI